ncbi:MAG: response regulator receiver protein [Gammaproteobacteria bacterium]|jgi:DNA-binding response OmpR family regulator|nr:response regulator receiver protein [Gammaproteobacteria bacterium]
MASILVVDDEPEVGEAIRRVLARAGFLVAVANSAEDGLRRMDEQRPDIVITDVIMPKVHGLELITMLLSRHPRVRIIAISGGGSFGPLAYKPDAISTHAYLAAAREAGAQELLTKPFDMSDLLAAVRKLLPN